MQRDLCCQPHNMSLPVVAPASVNSDRLSTECATSECSRYLVRDVPTLLIVASRSVNAFMSDYAIANDPDFGCSPTWRAVLPIREFVSSLKIIGSIRDCDQIAHGLCLSVSRHDCRSLSHARYLSLPLRCSLRVSSRSQAFLAARTATASRTTRATSTAACAITASTTSLTCALSRSCTL